MGGRPALRRAGRPCAGSSADAAEAGAQASLSIALPSISVFDGVFDPGSTTTALGDYGPGVYRRWMHAGITQEQDSETELSPVEEFIESLLVAVNDTASEVEYWGREDWLRVEAHRDTDEPSAEAGFRRFPSCVYIAYLDIAPNLIAPTVLWTSSPQDQEEGGRLVAVPAVAGRVLRFNGTLLHGVPRPACQYLGAADFAAGVTNLRHVLIINSWTDFAPDDDDLDDYGDDEEDSQEMLDWDDDEDEAGSVRTRAGCKPQALWRDVPLRALKEGGEDEAVEQATCTFSIPVFGQDSPFTTTVGAAALDVEAMLTQTEAPMWLRTLASGSCDVSDLQIGVPSEAGSRVERTDTGDRMENARGDS